MIKITKGLDIPISGAPTQSINDGPKVTRVALIGPDYNGMKPTMKVQVGDEVKCGQVLYECKKTPGVLYTSPAGGKIVDINRGERRAFQSIVVEISDNEEFIDFGPVAPENLATFGVDATREKLIQSGLWTSFRTRPFSKSPEIDSLPHSIFVTAMDTNPLAGNPELVIRENEMDFLHGLNVLSNLPETDVHLCKEAKAQLPACNNGKVKVQEFSGKHPAGLAGTHIHFIDPVSLNKTVWTIGYQDVIAIGKLFTTGKLYTERVVSLAGPKCKESKLYRTRLGANLSELKSGKLVEGKSRTISGSILDGRTAEGAFDFLGKFHNQVSVIADDAPREFMGWMSPGTDKYSVGRTFLSSLFRGKKFSLNTSENGSQRTMIPIGLYEKVMPLDILATQLLRAIDVQDMDDSQALGALELDEEDLALCTFVDPGKVDFGVRLREILTTIEKEG